MARLPLRMLNKLLGPMLKDKFMNTHQFSYGVSGGVDLVNAGVTAALEANPEWVLLSWDLRNAFNELARSLILQALIEDEDLHGLIPVFMALYGDRTPDLWYYGNGSQARPTSTFQSVEGTRQGCVFGCVFFNIAVKELYAKFAEIIGDDGLLFSIADDCKIVASPETIAKLLVAAEAMFATAGLHLERSKSRVFVRPLARTTWERVRAAHPILQDVDDGRGTGEDFTTVWPAVDGLKSLGVPVGNPAYVRQFLEEKRTDLHALQAFCRQVASAGFQREASDMLRIGAARKLSHLLRGLPREALTEAWLQEADRDNVQTWLAIHGAPADFFDSLSAAEQHTLVETLDLPPELGGDGLPSLRLQADEAHHSMWGLVLADLTAFLRSRPWKSYQDLAARLNDLYDDDGQPPQESPGEEETGAISVVAVPAPRLACIEAALEAEDGVLAICDDLVPEELLFASKMVNGEHNVETAGKDTPQWGERGSANATRPLVQPTPFTFTDFRAAAVRHAAEPARQSRHIQQASKVYNASHERSKAKLLTRCGRAGRATAAATHADVTHVALLKGVPAAKDWTHEGELYGISQLHRFGLPYGSTLSIADTFPDNCCKCKAPIIPVEMKDEMPNHVKLRLHADHAASCPGDGFYDAHHELCSLMVDGVLTATNITGRPAVNPKFIRKEVTGHRDDDDSRPADYEFPDLAHPGQMNLHDPAVVSALCDTYLDGSKRWVGYAAAQEERNKFARNNRSSLPVDTRGNRLIPMVMTEHGQMGAHMRTCLDEMATHLVNRPCGIPMMRGTFGVSKGVARAALTQRWDSILVWGVQRVKAAAIMNYWRAAAFLASLGSDGPGSGSGVAEPAVPDSRLLEYRTLDGIDIDMDALD